MKAIISKQQKMCFLKKQNKEGKAEEQTLPGEWLGMAWLPSVSLSQRRKEMSVSNWDMTTSMKPARNLCRRCTRNMQDPSAERGFGELGEGKRERNETLPISRSALGAQQQVQRLLALQAGSFARADFLIALPTTGLILY